MSRRLINSAIRAASVAAAVVAVVGCSDRSSGITGVTPPQAQNSMPTNTVGVVMGSVDENGNLTLTPLQNGSEDGASAVDGSMHASTIYGTQNLNVRIYANPATVSAPAGGRRTWTMKFGVRNLLPYPIGSNQAGLVPSDTTGIFLALISGPTISKTSGSCPAPCTITTTTFDGKGTFTGPNQPYVYWRERLAAKQIVAGADTVSNRRTITFSAPTQVTNATFFLIVGADWPPPAQTSWIVNYNAATDSAASQHAKPIWKKVNQLFAGTETWKPSGVDSISIGSFRDLYLARHDSVAVNSSAYVEAHVRVNGNQSDPETVFGFQDGTHLVAAGVNGSKVGFITFVSRSFGFFSVPVAQFVSGTSQFNVTSTALNTYRLRKFGTDSVTLEVNGVRRLKMPYSQVPAVTAQSPFSSPSEFFGQAGVSGNGSSAWSVVSYGIGVSQP